MSDFDLYEGQNCACGNDPACTNCGAGQAYKEHIREEVLKQNEQDFLEHQLIEEEQMRQKYWWKEDDDPNQHRRNTRFEDGELFSRNGRSIF